MWAWYNEIDPYAAQWLRNLIAKRLITDGEVDERPVQDIRPDDLRPFTRCHFFAGIAGWDIALNLSNFPADRPVWTGSCPCQPFSAAGQGRGFADERHLWPCWFHLIQILRPSTVLGEQVANRAGLEWFDLVQADLESAGYAVGAADLCAASVSAPHIRQRLWFVADALCSRTKHSSRQGLGAQAAAHGEDGGVSRQRLWLGIEGAARELAHPNPSGRRQFGRSGLLDGERPPLRYDADGCGESGMVNSTSEQVGLPRRAWEPRATAGELGDACSPRLQERERDGRVQREALEPSEGQAAVGGSDLGGSSPWSDCDWLPCTDGKARPVESIAQQMAHGLSGAMGIMRANRAAEKEIIDAAQSVGLADQILPALRSGYGAPEIWQSLGRRIGFSEASVLLACLCEHSRELGRVFDCKTPGGEQGGQVELRAVQQAPPSSARSPLGWQLSEQFASKLTDALSVLPQARALASFNGFPLSHGVQRRASKLRAYGNAIVPQVASTFIQAYLTS